MGKQVVPLRPIGCEVRPVIDILPQRLDIHDALADGGAGTCLVFQIVRGREMIGMRMRVENPFDRETWART